MKTAIAAIIAALVLAGCSGNDEQPADDVMTPIPVEEATPEPVGYSGLDVGIAVEASIDDTLVKEGFPPNSVLSASCEDVPVVKKGAISDCSIIADLPAPLDYFAVRVTFQDEYGHFEWVRY